MQVKVIVVQGVTTAALRAGAGHVPETPLPGERGNVAILGHTRYFGRPFLQLPAMRMGDRALLTGPFATYTYVAVGPFDGHPNPWTLEANDMRPLSSTGTLGTGNWLTLVTVADDAKQRVAVRLRLASVQPRSK